MELINGQNDRLLVTFQFSPGGSHSESGLTEKSELVLNSVETSTIDSAINLMNAYMSKELSLSHARLFVFSEELAYEGISKEIYSLYNDSQTRPSTNIIVSKNSARDYLKNSDSPLENLITKHYQIFPNSSRYTGYVYDSTLGVFLDNLSSETGEAVAILGGINSNENNSNNVSAKISDIKSSQTTFIGESSTENIGIGVFKGDKLVGELTALDTLCLSILKKKVDSFLIQFSDTENNYEKIDLMLYPLKNSSINVDIVKGNPYIKIKSDFIGRIYSMDENSKYLDNLNLENISNQASKYMNNIFTNYLYKTSLTFNSDINGFGKFAAKNFLTIPEFKEYNWKSNYCNSVFNVDISVNVESGFLVTET